MDHSPMPTRDDFAVLRRIQTRWEDNDHYGHVNNVVYYSFFDTAVNGWLLEATGVDTRELPEIGIVASSSCRFLRPLSFPDELEIGLATGRVGNSSVSYLLGVFREGRPELCALGEFVHVYVDSSQRRPVAIPPIIRAAVEKLGGIDS